MEGYQDIPRIFTAIAEWMSCCVCILALNKRWSKKITFMVCMAALPLQILFLTVTENAPLYLWLAIMLGAVLLMYGFLILTTKTEPVEAIYCCAVSFIHAEFAAALEWQLHSYLLPDSRNKILGIVLLLFIYSIIFALIYFMHKKMYLKEYLKEISAKEAITAVGIATFVFLFSNLSYVNNNSPFSGKILADIFLIRTLVDLCGIMILCTYQSRISELITEREKNTMQAVYQKQYDQYRYYQESMEMIHIKYHDLKHQIAGLRAENDPEKRKEWLDTLEEELDEHRLIHETGNKVFDTVYASKMFRAQKAKIRMTCVADGKLLDFLAVTDICTIFGNILDNAIESVIEISDPEKRMIHVSVSEQKGFVLIQASNYIEHDIVLKPGELPETSKANKTGHGYGLKSIRQCVRKYHGVMSVQAEKNWFELRILIPLK